MLFIVPSRLYKAAIGAEMEMARGVALRRAAFADCPSPYPTTQGGTRQSVAKIGPARRK